ncbi:hypothetical protein [Methylobacterium sp. Leaf466]|uniref:hypothetical protein n=1 Tax=Methylobacterium sp. Leaf466 TaxID=1736386 RepID=UPI0006F63B95|nr:hypothetical protein [Methylobacterium sp. Leaf466]KQT82403.1 hypothetical protein ASG59_18600 [Methylobacterium sp. Leaf466]
MPVMMSIDHSDNRRFATSFEEYVARENMERVQRNRLMLMKHDRLKTLSETHPFQFQVRHLRHLMASLTANIGQFIEIQNGVFEWLDEHAPGYEVSDSFEWIMIPDLVSAMAFKMRWA